MSKKPFQYKKYLCALFVSFAILSVGTLSLMEEMSIDYYTVLHALSKIIPASIVLGGLGWVMGSIIDRPKKRTRVDYNNVLLNELIKETAESETESEHETAEQ